MKGKKNSSKLLSVSILIIIFINIKGIKMVSEHFSR